MTRRREFLRNTLFATGAAVCSRVLPLAAADASSADSRVEILLDEPLGIISPNIYGHFTVHLSKTSMPANSCRFSTSCSFSSGRKSCSASCRGSPG
jgi:hypothetical protein